MILSPFYSGSCLPGTLQQVYTHARTAGWFFDNPLDKKWTLGALLLSDDRVVGYGCLCLMVP
jgi:hypothetical protein